jgi:hypothetical protein
MPHTKDPFICTPEHPWTPDMRGPGLFILHPSAKEVGEQQDGWPSGDIVTMRCPVCGYTWEKELPQ